MSYRLLRFLLMLLSRLPFGVLYGLSGVTYLFLYHIARYRRGIVRRNLTESFPARSGAEIKRIEKGFYRYFADNIFESVKMASMSTEEMSRRMRFTNVDDVNAVLGSGRSVALYLGHYANWEWISSMPLHLIKGVETAQIYHKLRNKAMDRIMLEMRGRFGATSIEMHRTARFITGLAAAHRTSIIGFIADQSPRKREVNHFLDFLNHRTPVLTGVEKLTKHYGFSPWFIRVRRVKRGYYEAEYVKMHEAPSEVPDFELTRIYFDMLQSEIERQPELYLWSHNRFKHGSILPSTPPPHPHPTAP